MYAFLNSLDHRLISPELNSYFSVALEFPTWFRFLSQSLQRLANVQIESRDYILYVSVYL